MLTIDINIESANESDMTLMLEAIARYIEQGYSSGYDINGSWKLSGEPEAERG